MGRHPRTRRSRAWLLWAGCLAAMPVVTGVAGAPAPRGAPSPQQVIVKIRKPKPREHLAIGDRWRVRASELPMQLPDPAWLPAETWTFVVTGLEKTPEGPRLIVTATREGAVKPAVRLQFDPDTQAILRADTLVPVQGGERTFVERASPGEPFVSDVSPVPLALPAPMPGFPPLKSAAAGGANTAVGAGLSLDNHDEAVHREGNPASASAGPALFTLDQRLSQRTDPVDAGVGRARIESGMQPLKRRREAALEPAGIPRFLTVIEGSGRRIEQVWDETTPWPIYSQTQTSRSWLVDYQKGK